MVRITHGRFNVKGQTIIYKVLWHLAFGFQQKTGWAAKIIFVKLKRNIWIFSGISSGKTRKSKEKVLGVEQFFYPKDGR